MKVKFDTTKNIIINNKTKIKEHLSNKEKHLLVELVDKSELGHVASRSDLKSAVWPHSINADSNLNKYILSLRRKLSNLGFDDVIDTVPTVGSYIKDVSMLIFIENKNYHIDRLRHWSVKNIIYYGVGVSVAMFLLSDYSNQDDYSHQASNDFVSLYSMNNNDVDYGKLLYFFNNIPAVQERKLNTTVLVTDKMLSIHISNVSAMVINIIHNDDFELIEQWVEKISDIVESDYENLTHKENTFSAAMSIYGRSSVYCHSNFNSLDDCIYKYNKTLLYKTNKDSYHLENNVKIQLSDNQEIANYHSSGNIKGNEIKGNYHSNRYLTYNLDLPLPERFDLFKIYANILNMPVSDNDLFYKRINGDIYFSSNYNGEIIYLHGVSNII
ncbi:helix-turn-helix domain-containing protein [Vibrio fluvialis]|nr:helix-turn-helix domain-containing protein [Vibrio fluvialis]